MHTHCFNMHYYTVSSLSLSSPCPSQDMPRPEFMLKDPVEMTEEEIRMARDFEKKEEAFLEEREKMKKALEAELRKLQSSILQAMEQFNERLHKLFRLKIKTEMSIQQVVITSVGGRLD